MLMILSKLKNHAQFTFTTKTLLLLYVFYIIRFHFKDSLVKQTFDLQNMTILAIGGITIYLLQNIFSVFYFKKKSLALIGNSCLIIVYLVLGTYNLRSGQNLDYSVISDNIDLATNKNSLNLVLDIPRRKDYIQLLILLLILLFTEIRFKKISTNRSNSRPFIFLLVNFVLFMVINLNIPYTHEQYSQFLKSIKSYYYPPEKIIKFKIPAKQYAYIKKANFNNLKSKAQRPHIFILFIESFNANFVNKKAPTGKTFTPFFNSLLKQGHFFNNFYGTSVQTSKGQLSTFCSILPLSHQKVFTHFEKLKLNCLPQILKLNGYETFFTKAFGDINFDNTKNFVSRNGFDHVFGMSNQYSTAKQRQKYTWGWGLQDDIYYKNVFSQLDKIHQTGNKKPFFVSLTTISNHMKFKDTPNDQRLMYPQQKNKKQYYANTIRISDKYLETFFSELNQRDYLKNSLVLILGDHSFPVGEHGSYNSENGYYNEYFKTPLLMLWKSKLGPKIINTLRSQVDIAPTILEFLGISSDNHFIGQHLTKSPAQDVYLVQPYAGGFVGTITPKNQKYIYHEKTQKEYLYDLNNDPQESSNIIGSLNATELKLYRNKASVIYLNDYLIKNNSIWK